MDGHIDLDRSHAAVFNPLRAKNKIVLMVALLNVAVLAVFSCGVLWMMFKTVQTTLHDESINQMLIFADNMGMRAAKFLQAGDMNSLQLLQQETKTNPNVYSFVRDAEGRTVTSTFEGNSVPDELKNINKINKGVPFATQETHLVSGGAELNIVDVASALAEGSLGSLHVGWNAEIQRNGIRRMFFPVVFFAVALFIILVGASVTLTSTVTGRILR